MRAGKCVIGKQDKHPYRRPQKGLMLVAGKRDNRLMVHLPFSVRLLTRDHKMRTDKHKSAWKFLLRKQSINQY
jgi:uncharacterized protein YjhX (UPF0386 family)